MNYHTAVRFNLLKLQDVYLLSQQFSFGSELQATSLSDLICL